MNMEEKLIAAIESLPMLPTVLVKLFSTSPEQDDYFESIVGLAEADPGLSLKIIRSSNSAASAPVKKIDSLPTAVLRLGAKRTVSLITSLMMAKVFNPKDPNEMDIWIHSLQVAAGARLIAALSKDASLDPEAAYLAGQFHDIGRLVLHAIDDQHFSVINERDFPNNDQLLQAEIDIYDGMTHVELGFRVCEHWKLPDLIAGTVRDYRTAFDHNTPRTVEAKYIAAVVLADQISQQLFADDSYMQMGREQLTEFFEGASLTAYRAMLGLNAAQLVDLIEEISTDASRIASAAGITYG